MIVANTGSTVSEDGRAKPMTARQTELARVIQTIDGLCSSLSIGDRIPTHTELMSQLSASERTVLRALDELQRKGRVVRRHGSGTFVASRSLSSQTVDKEITVKAIVAIAKPDQSFFDHAIELLYGHARDTDHNLFCCLITNDGEQESIVAGIGAADGYIVFNQRYAGLAERIYDQGRRVVLVGTPYTDVLPRVPYVCGDQERGGYLAANHLIELGHRRLAFIASADDYSRTLRWTGIQLAIEKANKAGESVDLKFISVETVGNWAADPAAAREYFNQQDYPTGVLAWNDREAAAFLSVLHKIGLNVPNDISLVGYDAMPESPGVSPHLTTVDGGTHEQLIAAVRILTRTNPPPANYTVIAIPTLIVKESTAPPKRFD